MRSAPKRRISAIWRRRAPLISRTSTRPEAVYAVMKELSKLDLLNLDCMTVTGHTVGENIQDAYNKNPEVIRR